MTHIAGKETQFDKIKVLLEHNHSSQKVYPDGASSVTLTTAASAWTHGAKTEIIPADTINDDFDVHWVLVSAISANGEYELKLYSGAVASEVEIGTVAFVRNAIQSQEGSTHMMMPIQAKGTRISASIASDTGNANTCGVKLFYHEY